MEENPRLWSQVVKGTHNNFEEETTEEYLARTRKCSCCNGGVKPEDRDEDGHNFYCSRDCKWAFLSVVRKRQASTAEAIIGRILGFYHRNDLEDYLARECLEKAIVCHERLYGSIPNLEKIRATILDWEKIQLEKTLEEEEFSPKEQFILWNDLPPEQQALMEKYNECVEDRDQYKQLVREKEKELLIEMEHTQKYLQENLEEARKYDEKYQTEIEDAKKEKEELLQKYEQMKEERNHQKQLFIDEITTLKNEITTLKQQMVQEREQAEEKYKILFDEGIAYQAKMEKEKEEWKKEADGLREELKRKSETLPKARITKQRKFNRIKKLAKNFIKN